MKRTYARVFFALTVYLVPNVSNAVAGHENGNSGGTLARLLSYAHREVVSTLPLLPAKLVEFQSPKLAKWYEVHVSQMTEDVKYIQFVPLNETISDSYYGYESWIRLKSTSGFIIEYNPEVSTYQKLVGIINPRYRGVAPDKLTTPSILDVTEYLLHEIGHKYELDEHDAWEFAQTLIKYFSFIKAILPLECNVSMTVRNVSPEFYLNQTVTLDSVHPAYLFKVGDIGYRLELLENLYETVWTIEFDTVEPLFNNTVVHSIIHQMSARAGTPFAGKIMLGYGHLADVSCK